MTDELRFHQLQSQIDTLREVVDRQGKTIDALIAAIPKTGQTAGSEHPSGSKSYREWITWLEVNGPAYRKTITDGTGRTLPGKQPVMDWSSVMVTWDDTAMPSDTLCKINGPSAGKGRPPTIYFLWSQRFDVLPKFGVGPARPDPAEPVELATGGIVGPNDLGPLTVGDDAPLLGVLSPTDENYTGDLAQALAMTYAAEDPPEDDLDWEDEPLPKAPDMETWHAQHAPFFDLMASMESKPTEQEKADLYATLPDGVSDPHAVVALAFRDAAQRYRGRSDVG